MNVIPFSGAPETRPPDLTQTDLDTLQKSAEIIATHSLEGDPKDTIRSNALWHVNFVLHNYQHGSAKGALSYANQQDYKFLKDLDGGSGEQ